MQFLTYDDLQTRDKQIEKNVTVLCRLENKRKDEKKTRNYERATDARKTSANIR